MVWQEAVFTIGGFLLAASLLPAVIHKQPPPATTSGLTGGILAIYAPTFLSLGLPLSSLAVAIAAVLWGVLLVQDLQLRRWLRG